MMYTAQPMNSGSMGSRIALALFMTMCTAATMAQGIATVGGKVPKHAKVGDWHLNNMKHELSRYTADEGWQYYDSRVAKISWCHSALRVTRPFGEQYCVLPNSDLRDYYDSCFCGDSILVTWNEGDTDPLAYDRGGDVITYRLSAKLDTVHWQMDWHGMKAFCLAGDFPTHRMDLRFGHDIHTWGILGENGEWLILPIFDAPFGFQDGFAEVMYYGQKRKINEKGEFVE